MNNEIIIALKAKGFDIDEKFGSVSDKNSRDITRYGLLEQYEITNVLWDNGIRKIGKWLIEREPETGNVVYVMPLN